ncbi:EF hand protein (macronuclear) [Tetrahymena thermophila SB210]|uniref:EF hand protein n=1 Tax=Tetrahymena thermophila (strain SB210) TaxID=312017 RepID=W7X907_TETTS|nr:EF hand protein [Tetrahymena thermophila SB210]EWS72868.1 EF hand protein [Tetrahymena thermophila SB210]|eukprot:XP_012654596.1 EF hand protein [Tetrahymena thermophila SB210]
MNLSNSFQQKFNQSSITSTIPPPQLPQQPSIKLLGSQPVNLDIKQQYQLPQNQLLILKQGYNQPAQIQQTQVINNQPYMQNNGSIQNIEVKQSSRVMQTNASSSSISSNSKFPYKVKSIIQEINFQNQNNNIPQVRNRFLNNLPEIQQNNALNSQIQYQIENGRSLSSNIIIPTNGSQIIQNSNSNNNFIQARRNSNCSTQHNSSIQQNNSVNNPIIQSGSYGLPQVPQQISSFNKKVDHINEKILNHENKLKEFLQATNAQNQNQQNQSQFEILSGSKHAQSLENSLKSQNVYIVNNKIKLSPEKNVIKTVITYVNQPQQINYSQMQSNLNKSSLDSKSNIYNIANPIQPNMDKQDNSSKYNINQLLDNSNFKQSSNISPSSVANQSPTILRAYQPFDLNKSQTQSVISPVSQGQNLFTIQNIPQYIDQKPNKETQKIASQNSTQGEKQRQSPALTFAQIPNGSISRNSSLSDFQLNKQGSVGSQSQSPLSKSPISSGAQQLISKLPLTISSPQNQKTDIKDQEKGDQSGTASNKNDNLSVTQNYLYKLKDSYFTPQNLDQSSTKSEINLIALSNNNISKTPSLNQTDLTPKNAPLINVQQTSSLSPSIQPPIQAVNSGNQQQNQQQQEDDKEKQIFIYQLNNLQSINQQNTQSQLKEEQINSQQLQKFKSAQISQINQLSPISNKATNRLSETIQNDANQIPITNLDMHFQQNQQTSIHKNILDSNIQTSVDQSKPLIQNNIIESQKQDQAQSQLNSQFSQQSVQGIPPYTPLLYPAYKGIQNPLENLSLIQKRTFLSRQPSQEKIQYTSHSPARSVQSDIQRSNYLQSPFSVVEKQINLLKSRPNSLENNYNSLSQSPKPQIQDVVQQISRSQNPQTRGLTFQQNYQSHSPTITAPIIKSIITSSPEGIKSQKISVSHSAQIPIAEGVSINAQVTTEHEIKDYQNYLRSSPSNNVKIIENIIIDNQQIQDSIDFKQNRAFTFQTISSPFPSANQNIQYNQPSIKKEGVDINQFANSPLRIQSELNNNSSYFQNKEVQRVIGQDSEGKQYQDILRQIDQKTKNENQTENRLFTLEEPTTQPLFSNVSQQIEKVQNLNQNLEFNQAIKNNNFDSETQQISEQNNLENEERRKRQFSFQENKNAKEILNDKKQDKIIEENIDKLIGNIFKEAMNNVNQTINKKRDQLNQQFQTATEQKKEEKISIFEKINSQQSNQQDSQINQQNMSQINNQMQNQEQNVNIKLDQNDKNEEMYNVNDQDESTKRSKQKNQQSEESQNQEIIQENQKIEKQLKQQPSYLAKNLNTINELDGDALSVFKKIENGNTFHLPLDDNKKKELAQSWQKPDYIQSLILGQLDKDKKQIKQTNSKQNLKNSLTQFSKPIERSSGNSQSSIKQSDSLSKSLKQNNSEIKNYKEEPIISNLSKTKGFLFKNKKEKSEQQFSQPPNIEQQFQNSSLQTNEIENKMEAPQEQVKKTQNQQPPQEKVFPFFQSQQNHYQKNKNSSLQNSQSNSRQNSIDKQRSILDKIENTFEEAQVIGSFGLQQNNTVTQLEVKNVKNQRSVAQFQQPYPSHQQQIQTNSKQNSPQSSKLKNFPPNQDVEKDELQYLDKAPIEYPQNVLENTSQDIFLTPQYEESEKDKKYRNFLLKMLNNYQEKREEILKKIDKLNKKQQVEQFQSQSFNANQMQKNNSSFVEPQKLIYKPQKINNDNDQIKQMSPKQTKYDLNNSQNKKNFDINKHINNAYQENEMQEQIQQYEMLIHNDAQSPANQRRNKDSYLNSLISSPDQTHEQKQLYTIRNYNQSPGLHDNEEQNCSNSQFKGRKLRPCELKNILQSQKDGDLYEKTTFKNDYYKNAKFKESPKKSKSPQTLQQNEKSPQLCRKMIDKQNKQISSELDKYKINRITDDRSNLSEIDYNYEVNNNNNKSQSKNLSTSKSPNRSTKSPYQKQPLIDSKRQKQKNQQINQIQINTKIQKPEINKKKLDIKNQNKKYQDQSHLKDKNKVQDIQMGIKNTQNKKGNQFLKNKYFNQLEDQNSDFNNSQNLENMYPAYGQPNKNYQQFNIQLQNTFESQNQNSKEDFQVEVNQNYSDYSNKQSNKKNAKNTQKIGQKQLLNNQYPMNIQSHLTKGDKNYLNSNKGEKIQPHQNIIQNINDMQKYSEYMIENNQNLLKDLDQSIERASRNSSQHNRSRNNSNSAGRSIIKEIGSFFKFQKEQEISPLLRPKSESAQRGQQYIDSRQSLSSPDRIQDSQNDQEFQHNSSNPINNKLYVQIRKTIHSISPPHSQEQQKGNYFNLPQYYSNNPQFELQRQHDKQYENRFEEDQQLQKQNQQKMNLQQIQKIIQKNNNKLKKNVVL